MNFSRSLTYKQDIDLLLESGTKAGVKCRSMDDHKLQTIIDSILDTFISSNDYFTRMLLDETHIGCYEDKIHDTKIACPEDRFLSREDHRQLEEQAIKLREYYEQAESLIEEYIFYLQVG